MVTPRICLSGTWLSRGDAANLPELIVIKQKQEQASSGDAAARAISLAAASSLRAQGTVYKLLMCANLLRA